MLRVEFGKNGNGTLTVKLEGRLVGPYAENARVTLTQQKVPKSIVVDLSEVTFVDALGEQLLSWLNRLGAKFVGENLYTRSLCERLQLTISDKSEKQSAPLSGTDTEALA